MVIVSGFFMLDPAHRDAFVAGRHDGMRTSRAEPGCLEYTFSADPLDPGRVLLFERWESQEALNAHLALAASRPQASPADSSATPVPSPTSASITVYDVTGERKLGE
jgi:quinol monooxygenase YgiN